MAVMKCKMCGGDLEIRECMSVAVCEYCGTKQTLPKLDNDRRANLYDRANHFRRNNEFDKAMGIYEQILNEDNTDAEAYWSIVLCRYGIEYVEDPASHKRVPTVNRAQFTSVFDDDNYKSALQYADAYQKSVYEEEAKAINEIQKGILAISQKEEPFDVFICYKETDASGRRTPDSVLATDLYHQLKQEGFKVFFARITLEDKLGTAYEPYIFAALNSAKVMVVLGTKPEYFNAVWVKNEWSRYLALIKNGAQKVLVPAYKDMDPYDLPEEFSHLQAQDMSKLGFMQDLIRGIKKLAAKEELKVTVKETVVVNNAPAAGVTNVAPLIKRAFMFLEDEEWENADEYCEKVLDMDPENAEAYLGKLMVELKVKCEKDLCNCTEPFDKKSNYLKIMRFCDSALRTKLESDIVVIKERRESLRIEAERKAEAERIEKEAKKKKNKKIASIVLSVVAVSVAAVVAFVTVIQPMMKYNSAVVLMEEKKFDEAIAAFEAMDGYKDSAEQIKECRYLAACSLMDDKKFGEAVSAFEAINGYKDSEKLAKEIKIKYLEDNIGNAEIGSVVRFGKYEQDNNFENGKESIEWIIVDKEGKKALLVSKYALESKQYDEEPSEGNTRNFVGVKWEDCALRNWLNNDFIKESFYDFESEIISETNVYENQRYKTVDKVFILSYKQVDEYFPNLKDKRLEPTEYLKSKEISVNQDGNVRWLTLDNDVSFRSTSGFVYGVSIQKGVYWKGLNTISTNGLQATELKPVNTYFAIRPAMWIDLSAIK